MAGLQPVGLYALKVPPGDILVPGCPEFAAMFRVSMAAIDPSAEPQRQDVDDTSKPRATLKIVRFPYDSDEDDEDDEDIDDDSFILKDDKLLNGLDAEDEDESTDEEIIGGPSNSKSSAKAQVKAGANIDEDENMEDDEDEDDEDEEEDEVAKALLKKIMKGKDRAEDDEDDDDDSDIDLENMDEVDETVVCTLDPEKQYQQPLDISISEGERVFFKVSGTHTIHLTGNFAVPLDDGRASLYDEDEDEVDEEDEYDLSPDEEELAIQAEDDDSDELDDLPNPPRITEVDFDAEPTVKVKPTKKALEKGKNKRPAEDSVDEDEEAEALDDLIAKSKAIEAKAEAAATAADSQPKKLSKAEKKRLKKLKKNDGEATSAPTTTADPKATDKKPNTPSSNAAAEKKVQFAKNLEQGPTPNGSSQPAKSDTKPQQDPSKKSPSLGIRDVQGVTVDDRKIGAASSRTAKPGDRLELRYIGKLESTSKVFDANKSGKPFAFKLGAGEVIKGWDVGLAGITVGGERRLTIPSHLAYGKKGAPPDIPPNAKLVFDVKCLSIK